MNNLSQNPASDGINAVVLNVSRATPLYLFLACIGSFIILLVVQIVHDIDFWTATMPTIGIFVAIAGALFVQVVRFGGLIGSTFNFSENRTFAGVLCMCLSIGTSLWEHNHIPGMAAYFINGENTFLAKEQFVSFLRILIWIGLGLEILIVASTYGKSGQEPAQDNPFDAIMGELNDMRKQLAATDQELINARKEAAAAIADLLKNQPMSLDPLSNGNSATR